MKVKRYWYQDLRTYEDYVTSARGKKHLAEKTRIPIDKIRIMKVYSRKNLNPDDLILLY